MKSKHKMKIYLALVGVLSSGVTAAISIPVTLRSIETKHEQTTQVQKTQDDILKKVLDAADIESKDKTKLIENYIKSTLNSNTQVQVAEIKDLEKMVVDATQSINNNLKATIEQTLKNYLAEILVPPEPVHQEIPTLAIENGLVKFD